MGFEPMTYALRVRCSAGLSYPGGGAGMVASPRSLRHLHRMARHDRGDSWRIKRTSRLTRCNTRHSCIQQPCV
jgi:hypothetical protein